MSLTASVKEKKEPVEPATPALYRTKTGRIVLVERVYNDNVDLKVCSGTVISGKGNYETGVAFRDWRLSNLTPFYGSVTLRQE